MTEELKELTAKLAVLIDRVEDILDREESITFPNETRFLKEIEEQVPHCDVFKGFEIDRSHPGRFVVRCKCGEDLYHLEPGANDMEFIKHRLDAMTKDYTEGPRSPRTPLKHMEV